MKTRSVVSWFKALITLILISASSLKAEWFNVNHYYTSQNLSSIFSYNSDVNIILVNNGYSYLKTTNGGVNYSSGQISSSIYLKNLKILNENVYLALTNSGLYKTTNSGINWFSMNSPNASYSSIEFLNDTTFYLCINTGSLATLYKTTNGGVNWVQKNCPSNVSGISFVSEDIGFLIKLSYPCSIWKSTDGSLTWQAINAPSTTSLSYVKFISPNTGFCETSQVLLRTLNNGTTWDTIQKSAYVEQISFINSNTGFYSGYRGVYKSTNSGLSFFTILNRSAEGSGVNSFDGNTIFTSYDAGIIKKSTDGGNTWSCISKKWDLKSHFFDMYLSNTGKGYIFNLQGGILKTSNSGVNWDLDTITLKSTIGPKSIHFLNQDTGYVLFIYINTNRGGVLRTRDGCNSFDTLTIFDYNISYNDLLQIYMYNDDIGLYAIPKGIYYTSNGGSNWTRRFNTGSDFLWNFSITSGDTAFTTQIFEPASSFPSHTRILMSTNKGLDWSQIKYIDGVKLYESYFLNGNTGFFAGTDSWSCFPLVIYKTTNACSNIVDIYTGLDDNICSFRDIYFQDNSTGYILPYRTTNQGNNWSKLTISSSTLRKVKFLNSNTGFIVGNDDIILKTTDGGGTTFAGNNNQTVALKYELSQNYPNPFNPTTKIKFDVMRLGDVKIVVYDITGRVIQTLVNERLQPGTYEASFNGSQISSGVYFYRMIIRHGGSSTDRYSETKRMVLIK